MIRYARENNILISYDPNLRLPLWSSLETAKREIKKSIPLADILKLNEDELSFLTGITPEVAKDKTEQQKMINVCREIYESGPQLVIVTLGAEGSFYYRGEKNYGYIKGQEVNAVDTTGAGDGFVKHIIK